MTLTFIWVSQRKKMCWTQKQYVLSSLPTIARDACSNCRFLFFFADCVNSCTSITLLTRLITSWWSLNMISFFLCCMQNIQLCISFWTSIHMIYTISRIDLVACFLFCCCCFCLCAKTIHIFFLSFCLFILDFNSMEKKYL